LSFETAQDIFSDKVWRLIREQIGRKKSKKNLSTADAQTSTNQLLGQFEGP
jgi:hypothetical protein